MFPEKQPYRPETLQRVGKSLDALNPMTLGVGEKYREMLSKQEFITYKVKQRDSLRAIARRFYGKADDASKIFDVNRDVLEHPDLIFAEQELRLPKEGMIPEQSGDQQVAATPASSTPS
ncbi:LysM peptidoglycan-binding domain-containing protein [Bradyrhizobium sp.]